MRSNKIYSNKVENVHFEKNLGIVKILRNRQIPFIENLYPEYYKYIQETLATGDTNLDIEPLFGDLEKTPAYMQLISTIVTERIQTESELDNIIWFVILQRLRNALVLRGISSRLKLRDSVEEIDTMVTLLKLFSGGKYLLPDLISAYKYRDRKRKVLRKFVLYTSDHPVLPLSDSAILPNPSKLSMLVPISPKALLEIKTFKQQDRNEVCTHIPLSPAKIKEYIRIAISKTTKELIFSEQDLLSEIQHSPRFKEQVGFINSMDEQHLFDLFGSSKYLGF